MFGKVERLGTTLHANIHSNMETWMEAIRKVQARRKEEIINATNRHRNGPRHQEDKGQLKYALKFVVLLQINIEKSNMAKICMLRFRGKYFSKLLQYIKICMFTCPKLFFMLYIYRCAGPGC